MTAMLDRPAVSAGLPAPTATKRRKPPKRRPWNRDHDHAVVDRIIAHAEGKWTPPLPRPTDEERVAIARWYIEHGRGPTAVSKALRASGKTAARLIEEARLDQLLDEIEVRL